MKKRIQEERERIISLLGINEQEEIRVEKPEITLKDKLDNLTLFSSKNGSEIKTNIEDIISSAAAAPVIAAPVVSEKSAGAAPKEEKKEAVEEEEEEPTGIGSLF